jgi:hypothetical protein
MVRAWNPAAHPRDRRGRFTRSRTVPLTDAERQAARSAVDGFKPRRFGSRQEMSAYLDSGPELSESERGAVDAYTGDTFLRVNQGLRAGRDPGGDVSVVRGLRAAMRPTQDDLILTRTTGVDAFKDIDLENLVGMKVKDAGFSSTSLGPAYGGSLGNVTMKIAVPKGTPALFAAPHSRNPHEMEVILPDGMEFAVASAKRNDRYGWDVSLVVIPKRTGSKVMA